jgi:chorismate dehydratase
LEKIRVGAVSYRNAKPLVYGLAMPDMTDVIDLSFDYPARVHERLMAGSIDVGLIPVAATINIPLPHFVGHFGIAADGPVGSVALFSQCPIEAVEEVVLDYQSRTSVELLKILLRDHWNKEVQFINADSDNYIQEIEGKRAGLIIGDRALLQMDRFPFIYDLAGEWKKFTGLPFVFAAWVSTRPLPVEFVERFDKANEQGLSRLPEIADRWGLPGVDMHTYFTDRIHYRINERKQAGMEKFLSLLRAGSIT